MLDASAPLEVPPMDAKTYPKWGLLSLLITTDPSTNVTRVDYTIGRADDSLEFARDRATLDMRSATVDDLLERFAGDMPNLVKVGQVKALLYEILAVDAASRGLV